MVLRGRLAGEVHRAAVCGRADRRRAHTALDLNAVYGAQKVVEIVEEERVLRGIVERRTVESHVDARLLDPSHAEVRVVGADARIRVPVHRRGVRKQLRNVLSVAECLDLLAVHVSLGHRHVLSGPYPDDRNGLLDGRDPFELELEIEALGANRHSVAQQPIGGM